MAETKIDDELVLKLNKKVKPSNFDFVVSWHGLSIDPACLYKEVFGRSDDGRLLVFTPVYDFGEFALVTEEEYVRDGKEFLEWYARCVLGSDTGLGNITTLDELNAGFQEIYDIGDKASREL